MLKKPEKILGVLGGMGPAATAEFLRILAKDAPAASDAAHPKIILYSDPTIPDRSDGIMGQGPDPLPAIEKGLFQLIEWGADVLAVPCNTAHFFIDRFLERGDKLPDKVQLVHIVEATVNAARLISPEDSWLLATSGTQKSLIYQTCAAKQNYRFLRPTDAQQERVHTVTRMVKAGDMLEAGKLLYDVVTELWREHEAPVVTACTELPLAWAASGLPEERQISSITCLSNACLDVLYERK